MTQGESSQLQYASPELLPRRQIFSVWAFVFTAVPLGFVYLMVALIIPRFETIYSNFGTRLPSATIFVLDIARIGVRYGYLPQSSRHRHSL